MGNVNYKIYLSLINCAFPFCEWTGIGKYNCNKYFYVYTVTFSSVLSIFISFNYVLGRLIDIVYS